MGTREREGGGGGGLRERMTVKWKRTEREYNFFFSPCPFTCLFVSERADVFAFILVFYQLPPSVSR